MARVPSNAFDEYAAGGDGRSYSALARKYGVTKRAIGKRAAREHWQERLTAIRIAARKQADAALADTLHEVHSRHLRILRAIEGKGLAALQALPMTTASEAARTVLAALAQERDILGVPGGTGGVSITVVTGVPAPILAPES